MQRSAATGVSPSQTKAPAGTGFPILFALFAAFAAAACLFAFVGSSNSGYWTDELFTLFVVDHHGGLAEVLRRALTDTHPPAYYFLLHLWIGVLGSSEAATRLSSALFAVSAAVVFFLGLRRVFSPTARAFALAMALNATFWFDQSQNIRSYSLSMLISALLLILGLAARRQVRAGAKFPLGPCAGLILTGVLGSFCHAYIFLEVGLVYVFLVLTVPSTGLRAALVLTGMGIAALDWVYVQALLHATQQDVHHMWFRNSALFFFNQITVAYRITFGITGAVAFILLAISARRRRREAASPAIAATAEPVDQDRGWVVGLSAFGHLGMIGLGIAVSLAMAPSMSSINLAAAGPLLWTLMAWLYDIGGPRTETRAGKIFAGVLVLGAALHLPILAGRFMVRTEDWRGTARYVAALPGCAGEPIPVVLPKKFGPPTPFFRTLAEQSFYGRYFPQRSRLHAYLADELLGRRPVAGLSALLAARARGTDACPLLAWGIHDLEPDEAEALLHDLQRAPGIAPARVVMRATSYSAHEEVGYSHWPAAFVYLAVRPSAP